MPLQVAPLDLQLFEVATRLWEDGRPHSKLAAPRSRETGETDETGGRISERFDSPAAAAATVATTTATATATAPPPVISRQRGGGRAREKFTAWMARTSETQTDGARDTTSDISLGSLRDGVHGGSDDPGGGGDGEWYTWGYTARCASADLRLGPAAMRALQQAECRCAEPCGRR